jgi:hypothetical protein
MSSLEFWYSKSKQIYLQRFDTNIVGVEVQKKSEWFATQNRPD